MLGSHVVKSSADHLRQELVIHQQPFYIPPSEIVNRSSNTEPKHRQGKAIADLRASIGNLLMAEVLQNPAQSGPHPT